MYKVKELGRSPLLTQRLALSETFERERRYLVSWLIKYVQGKKKKKQETGATNKKHVLGSVNRGK